MWTHLKLWLNAILAGLFALAIVPAPAEQARAVVERAAFALAYAMPDGTLPELCADHSGSSEEHSQHLLTPACFVCVLMVTPGLPAPPFAPPAPIATAVAADRHDRNATGLRQVAWALQWARAPPLGLPV